jgi:hypothetical protein
MKLSLLSAALAVTALSLPAHAADPVASIVQGWSFSDYLTTTDFANGVGVGDGKVDNDAMYFIKEKQIGNVQSWLIFFDPKGGDPTTGTITFDLPIVGLDKATADVLAGNATWGNPLVTYLSDNLTGLEMGTPRRPGPDSASFSGNVLTFKWVASDPGDHVRVFTQAVPEPSTYALMALGLVGVGAIVRRRKAA